MNRFTTVRYRPLFSVLLFLSFLLWLPIAQALDVPTPTGYVNDLAGVLTVEERASLEQLLGANGSEVAILIIPSLEGEDLDMYANTVFRTWGVGDKERNDGVLLLVAINDRKMRIEVGYGKEGELTDVASGLIIREILAPAFREERYYDGLRAAIDAIRGDSEPITRTSQSPPDSGFGILFALLIGQHVLMSIAGVIFRKHKSSRYASKMVAASIMVIIAFAISVMFGFVMLFLSLFLFLMSEAASSGAGGLGGMGGFGGGGFGGFSGGFGGFGGGSSGGGGGGGGW